jgi:hypothetical protein
MKISPSCLGALLLLAAPAAVAQPSFVAPAPVPHVVERADLRRDEYRHRIKEVLVWRAGLEVTGKPETFGIAEIVAKLAQRQGAAGCSRRLIELLGEPQSGDMFWMFPMVGIAYLGRDQLSPEAKAAMRAAWRTYFPSRGDTENHWVMYYASLYLMAELYPDDPASSWYNGKSSAENRAEARGYLISWMNLTTTIGQGEYNCTHYIGEYTIPLLYLAAWSRDPEMRQRGRMMLDWVLADFAENTLDGLAIGAHARTDDTQVLEKWNGLSSFYSWLCFGNCPPPARYGDWGVYFAAVADNYELPEIIYRIGTDRPVDVLQRDLKRTRHRWRNSPVRNAPVYKTTYLRRDYAVGSDQGGLLQPSQLHSWDVTWTEPDPRGRHNTIFSLQPYSSVSALQMYYTELPDNLVASVVRTRPSYDSPDKFLGGSPYEQVFQDRDTIVALYQIAPGTRFSHVNGFFSRDLVDVSEDPSGWIFARGGRCFLAYRPLAPYEWVPTAKGDRRLYSPHLHNGTIVQAASVDEFASLAAFKAAINALPLTFSLEPTPTAKLKTLRGTELVCTYGQPPVVNGQAVDYAKWQLFAGPWLNAGRESHRLTITHGRLKRVLDFNALTISDSVTP